MSNIKFVLGKNSKHDEKDRPWYDTIRGIQGALISLEAFMKLVSERHTAGYSRKKRLNEFYILGRYWMDTCGNCGKISGWIPKEQIDNLPDVITRDDFWAFVKENIDDAERVSISSGMSSELPHNGVTCPVCRKGWTIHNCHDTVVRHKTETLSLADFVGGILGDVKARFAERTDANYRMQNDILIRNDRFIDTSPKYPGSKEKWEQVIVKNERGWISERDGINDYYVIQEGDEGHFNIWTYYHGKCNDLNIAFKETERFQDIFEKSGFRYCVFNQIPNKYCSCKRCSPWFKVETEFGTITIGWRKRVINIDWSSMEETLRKCGELPKQSIASLFNGENVTKGATSIHAWGWKKAEEYLTKIYKTLSE